MRIHGCLLGLFLVLGYWNYATAMAGLHEATEALKHLHLPKGFHIHVFGGARGARSLSVLPQQRALLVGTRGGTVHVLHDLNGDNRAETSRVLLQNLQGSHGVLYHQGFLYVGERHQITRRPYDGKGKPGKAQRLLGGLPNRSHHGTRDLVMGPKNRLYVAVGVPCNICQPKGVSDAILRLPAKGGKAEVFVRGVRNAVGLAFHPRSNTLFFTDNGADGLGDDAPPDELNHAPTKGLHFGYPWYGGGRVRTPQFRTQTPPSNLRFPVHAFGAHVAALGLHFYRGSMFPPGFQGDAFVAQHGSWNRSKRVGYRVMRVHFKGGNKPLKATPFAHGWLRKEASYGRPVDVVEWVDGSLLVSDDQNGVIYRIAYSRP